MLLLTADDPSETDWRRCRPVPGSLFVVGDPKQSIYRFRRADIVTYNEVKRIIESTRRSRRLADSQLSLDGVPCWNGSTRASPGVSPRPPPQFAPVYSSLQVGRLDERSGDLAGLYVLKAPGGKRKRSWRMKARSWRERFATRLIPAARFPDRCASTTSPKPPSRVIS